MSPQTVNANNPLTAAPYKDYGEMFDHIMAGVKTDKVILDTNTAALIKKRCILQCIMGTLTVL